LIAIKFLSPHVAGMGSAALARHAGVCKGALRARSARFDLAQATGGNAAYD
jgi:hypothetical protein